MALKEKITAVADAIRTKTGKSEKLTLAQMPAEIAGIQTGGGSVMKYDVDDVTFYDYDGTIVYSCSMAEAQNLQELPTPPAHDGLVFQEWNWTLEEIKSSSVGADVGAMYDTRDGSVMYDIVIESVLERTVKIAVGSGGYEGELAPVIDWGDGNTGANISESVGNVYRAEHTYAKNGTYRIKISKGAAENRKLKMMSYGSRLFGNDVACSNILKAAYIGTDCTTIDQSTYAYLPCLQYICMHKDTLLPSSNGLCRDSSLTIGIIPRTHNGGQALYNSNPISVICTHPKMTSYACFSYCGNLRRLIIPDSVVSAGYISGATVLKSVKFGNSLRELKASAFTNNGAISVLSFPASLTSIGDSSMRYLSVVKEYHFKSAVPPALEVSTALKINTFDSGTTKIYVPAGCADAYKAATNWAALADYIVEEEEQL